MSKSAVSSCVLMLEHKLLYTLLILFIFNAFSPQESALDKQLGREKSENLPVKTVEHHPPCVPLKKPLPDLRTLGPVPAKPLRPPLVDLSYYHAPLFTGMRVSASLHTWPLRAIAENRFALKTY